MVKRVSAPTQISINFDAGLRDRYPEYGRLLQYIVHRSDHPLKYIAADLDDASDQTITSSKLSRMLADYKEGEPEFPARLLPDLIRATGDLSPIYWLIEEFLDDPGAKRKRAVDQIADLLPQLQQLVDMVNDDSDDSKPGAKVRSIRSGT